MKRERVLTEGTTFYMSKKMRNDLDEIAELKRIKISELLREIVNQFLTKKENYNDRHRQSNKNIRESF